MTNIFGSSAVRGRSMDCFSAGDVMISNYFLSSPFLFGMLLLSVALLGGGFEISGMKVPSVGRPSRWLSGVFATAFLVLPASPDAQDNARALIENLWIHPVKFAVGGYLAKVDGVQELETNARIRINGDAVAEFTFNPRNTSQYKTVRIPSSKSYRYVIEGYSIWVSTKGQRIPILSTGDIQIGRGSTLVLAADSPPKADDKNWQMTLESR